MIRARSARFANTSLIDERGCELLYLPAYSPDYNFIEEACSLRSGSYCSPRFSKIKNLLRKTTARSRDALIEAIGAALSAVTAEDVRGFFEHAGYRPASHLL